jgi:hypothetical protein
MAQTMTFCSRLDPYRKYLVRFQGKGSQGQKCDDKTVFQALGGLFMQEKGNMEYKRVGLDETLLCVIPTMLQGAPASVEVCRFLEKRVS